MKIETFISDNTNRIHNQEEGIQRENSIIQLFLKRKTKKNIPKQRIEVRSNIVNEQSKQKRDSKNAISVTLSMCDMWLIYIQIHI